MPHGVQLAQTAHAAAESCGGVPTGTIVVVLAVANEAELVAIRERLAANGVALTTIIENEGEYANQATAVGCAPVSDRLPIRKAVSALRLAK